jgi:hypothetical protein
MSMFWLWDRLTGDPDRIVAEEKQVQAARAPRDEDDGAPPVLDCRVCGYEGPERFCPHCLADTMIARATARR